MDGLLPGPVNFASFAIVRLHMHPMYCPNCSAKLAHRDTAICWNCLADFTSEDGWKPIERPQGPFRKFSQQEIAPKIKRELHQSDAKPQQSNRGSYLLSGFFFCLFAGLLVSATFSQNLRVWALWTALLTAVSFWHTAVAKNPTLVKTNFLAVTVFYAAVTGYSLTANANAEQGWFGVLMISAFTFGAPVVIPFAALIAHASSCLGARFPPVQHRQGSLQAHDATFSD